MTKHHRLLRRLSTIVLPALLAFATLGHAADKGEFSTKPTTNDGQKWRIAFYEGGPYTNYQNLMVETVRSLMKLGWIDTSKIPPQKGEETEALWNWLVYGAQSDYLEFVADGHYSAGWDKAKREETAAEVIRRMTEDKDIDLVIAMGTWAGKDLANDQHHTPTMVMSTSDPLSAGIIKSIEDSGYEHLHAIVDPYRYKRQIQVFHEIVGFKTLGILFEDSVDGRSYAAVDMVNEVAAEFGFEVVPCHTESDIKDTLQAEQSVVDCFKSLATKTEAIYVTRQGGVTKRSLPQLVDIANEHDIATFSQAGSDEVKNGILVSLSQAAMRFRAGFHAETFAKVFNGAAPNQLDQVFQEPPKIAINLKTAEQIGFNPPIVLLGAADEIYEEIGAQ